MLEVITGLVLATAAGLNAYIPLLGLGVLARFSDLISLPDGWEWLSNEWVLAVLGILLALEVFVDKIPGVDTVNDIAQSVIRPASGGLVFSAGVTSETTAVTDPVAFAQSDQLWPFLIGVAVALIPHLLKAFARPIINALSGGLGGVVISVFEDLGAALFTILALTIPVVALILAVVAIVLLVRRLRTLARTRSARRNAMKPGPA